LICEGLTGFQADVAANPLRLNLYRVRGITVVVDYAHNPAGLRALTRVSDQMRPQHRRVIGMISIPGDRRDRTSAKWARLPLPR
jgi:cyanophycin synthetase